MPIARHKATNSNGGNAVNLKEGFGLAAMDLVATKVSASISVTVDTYIVFDVASAGSAATAMTAGTAEGNRQAFRIPANAVVDIREFNPATTWVRAVGGAAGVVSMLLT